MKKTYTVEALEKFIVRTFYVIEADSAEEAVQLARAGVRPYDDHKVEEGGEEWLETVEVNLLKS